MAGKRKNGQGTVRHRKDGRWEGRHIVGYDEKGKAITKNVLAKTKAACIAKLKKLQAEYNDVPSSKVEPDMRFGDWLKAFHSPKHPEGLRGVDSCSCHPRAGTHSAEQADPGRAAKLSQ